MKPTAPKPWAAKLDYGALTVLGLTQVTYQWRKFRNEARTDGLELEHWVKCYRDHLGKIRPETEGEYKYAKYDRKVCLYSMLGSLHIRLSCLQTSPAFIVPALLSLVRFFATDACVPL